MSCEQIQNDLSAYVDGELSPTRKSEVEAHVNGCAACQQRVAALKKLAAGVAAMPKLQPAPLFLADVRRKLRTEPGRRESWADVLFRPYWLKVPVEALALILVAGLVVVLVRPYRPGQVSQPAAAKSEKALQAKESAGSLRGVPPSVSAPAAVLDGVQVDKDSRGETVSPGVVTGSGAAAADEASAPQLVRERAGSIAGKTDTLKLKGDEVLEAKPAATPSRDDVSRVATAAHGDLLYVPLEQSSETISIKGSDLVAVQKRAEALASSFGGRIIPLSQAGDRPGMFYVVVPTEFVEQFKARLLEAERLAKEQFAQTKEGGGDGNGNEVGVVTEARRREIGEKIALNNGPASSNAPSESAASPRPMSVLEIKVVPADK